MQIWNRIISIFLFSLTLFMAFYCIWSFYHDRLSLSTAFLFMILSLFSSGWITYQRVVVPLLLRIREGANILKERLFYNLLSYLLILSSSIFIIILFLISHRLFHILGQLIVALLYLSTIISMLLGLLLLIFPRLSSYNTKNRL